MSLFRWPFRTRRAKAEERLDEALKANEESCRRVNACAKSLGESAKKLREVNDLVYVELKKYVEEDTKRFERKKGDTDIALKPAH